MQTLEGRYYSDPTIFALERSKVFQHTWHMVGHEGQIEKAGDYISTTIAGANVFVMRGEDGKVRAFRNVCRHRGALLLAAGEGNCPEIKCKYHDWRYSPQGTLKDTPWYGEATPFDINSLSLYSVPVELWRGLIFLSLEPKGSLLEQLGDLPKTIENAPLETFSVGAQRTFTAPVNWKIYVDQYCEAYHVPTTHSPDKAIDMQNYDTHPHNNMMLMQTLGDTATKGASYYGGKWIWAWPNWTLALFDGGMKTSRLEPLSASETRVHYHFFFSDMSPEAESARARVVEATSSIFWEDIAGCELVQANHPAIGFHSGPMHPRLEEAVAYFQRRIRAAVDE